MKILFDVGHPADVHLYKNCAQILTLKGHEVFFTAREKEITSKLLKSLDFKFSLLGKNHKSLFKKIIGLFKYELKLLIKTILFKPDLILSLGSFYAAHVAYLLKTPHITFEDTGNIEQIKLYRKFTKVILTPSCLKKKFSSNQIYIDTYKEIAYLHPNYFNVDKNILNKLGIEKDELVILIRFVSWNATHDSGHQGISSENKINAIKEFSKFGKVFISSEFELPNELKKYLFPLPPEEIHHLMANASLIFGESATMVTEGAVLGVPGIYLDNTSRSYTKELEKNYNLIYNFTENYNDQILSIQKGIEILRNYKKDEWLQRREKLLSEKIDFTAFLVWYIESWPKSFQIMKENPDYQFNFK